MTPRPLDSETTPEPAGFEGPSAPVSAKDVLEALKPAKNGHGAVWKVAAVVVAALGVTFTVATFVFASKGQVVEAVAAEREKASEEVGAVETRVTKLEGVVDAHHAQQAKDEPRLQASLADLYDAVKVINDNQIKLGVRLEERSLLKLPPRRTVKDTKP